MKKLCNLITPFLLLIYLVNVTFIQKNTNNIITLIILLLFLFINIKKIKKNRFKNQKQNFIYTLLLCLSFLFIYYFMGIKTGYEINYAAISNEIIKPSEYLSNILIIIIVEFIRITFYCSRNGKIDRTIMFFNFVLIDILLSPKLFAYDSAMQMFILVANVITRSICCNLLLCFLCKENYFSCLAYRIILDMYIYVIPVQPKVNEYIDAVLFVIFPFIFYEIVYKITFKKNIKDIKQSRRIDLKICSIMWCLSLCIIVLLVSGVYKYRIIAIGSPSMSGTINKGDAIIYKKYDKTKDELAEGDIIVFEKNGVLIIHRINFIYSHDEKVYLTKGDANDSVDNWVLKEENIIGIFKVRLKYLGVPSVFLSEAI